ncbi:MAG: WG repeat-containing protein [Peptococcaceae bacterium]|nr:WG repeat-containing protein [Peptococcaceae bacterium]
MKKVIMISVAILLIAAIGAGVFFLLIKGEEEEKKENDEIMQGYMKLLQQNTTSKTFSFVDTNATIVEYSGYDWMDDFFLDAVPVQKGGKYAIINKEEKVLIEYGKYEEVQRVQNKIDRLDLFIVKDTNSKYGVIDLSGEIIVPCQYDSITGIPSDCEIKLLEATDQSKDNKYIYYTLDGKKLFEKSSFWDTSSLYYKSFESFDDLLPCEGHYYNGKTGEKILEFSTKDSELRFHVLKKTVDRRAEYYLLNNAGKIDKKLDLDLSHDVGISLSGDKYLIINNSHYRGKDAGYEGNSYVYDEENNEVYKSSYPLSSVTDLKDVYFIETITESAEDKRYTWRLLDENFNLIKEMKDVSTNFIHISVCPYIAVQNENGISYTVYDFKGNEVMKTVRFEGYSDFRVIIQYDASDQVIKRILYTHDYSASLELTDTQTLYKKDISLLNHYVLIEENGKVKLINMDTKKVTFEFDKSEKVQSIDNVPVISLSDGYYDYNGKKLLDKESDSDEIKNY